MLTDSSIHPWRSRRVLRVATALFLLIVAGCSLDATNTRTIEWVDLRGSSTVTISGAYTTSAQGHADMLSGAAPGTTAFELMITPMDFPSTPWIIYVYRPKGRPALGTYSISITPDATMSARLDIKGASTLASYVATTGELVITSSSTSSVRGTLRFTGSGPDGATVTVDSEFTAICPLGIVCL
jgi:hypothetical protein